MAEHWTIEWSSYHERMDLNVSWLREWERIKPLVLFFRWEWRRRRRWWWYKTQWLEHEQNARYKITWERVFKTWFFSYQETYHITSELLQINIIINVNVKFMKLVLVLQFMRALVCVSVCRWWRSVLPIQQRLWSGCTEHSENSNTSIFISISHSLLSY